MRLIAKNLRDNFRSLGRLDGFLYLFSEGMRRLSGNRIRLIKYYLVVQPIQESLSLSSHLGRSVIISDVTLDNPLLELIAHPRKVLDFRYGQGAHCLLAIKGEALAGYLWYVKGPYQEDEVRCCFVPEPVGQSVWDFDVFVSPGFRLGPSFMRLWQKTFQVLYAEGYRYSCSRISAFNPTSLFAHRRLGATVVGSSLFFCIGGWQFMFANPGPRWHLSFSNQSIPRVPVGIKVS